MNTELLIDTIAEKVADGYLAQSFNASALRAMFNEMVKEALVDCRESGIVNDIAEEVIEHGFCTCGQLTKKELSEIETEEQKKNAELFKQLFKSLEKYEVEYKSMLASVWEKERKIIISNLKKMKKAWLQKDLIDDLLYPVAPFEKLLSDNALIIDLKILDEQGKSTMASIAGTDVVFSVTNPEVQNWLKTYTPKFSKELEKVSVAKLRKELSEGIAAGEGIPELTKRVNETYKNWNKVRSESIARSETMRASNQGSLEAYKQSGVVVKKTWVTHHSPATCQWCIAMDGKTISIEKSFFTQGSRFVVEGQTMKLDYETVEAPPLHTSCLLPKTKCISPGGFVSGLRVKYNGKAIKFTYSDGSELSVTPNHLLLTPYGFAAANLLCRGNDVIYCPDFERIVFSNPDNNRQPTSVEDIISSLSEISGMISSRVPVSSEYLHGDGRFCDGNIDIIFSDSFLGDTIKPSLSQGINTNDFDPSYSSTPAFFRLSSFTEQFKRLAFATDSIMGGSRQSSSFFRARSSHPGIHCGTAISGSNIAFNQSPPNHSAANFKSFRKSLFRLSGIIKTKKIIDIKVFSFHGDVYDFQTPTSLYIANSVVSSNCRCTVVAEVEKT